MHLKLLQKWTILKSAEATGDLVAKKIASKSTKNSMQTNSETGLTNRRKIKRNTKDSRYIFRKRFIIDDLRLIQYNNGIQQNNKFIWQYTTSTILI